MALQYVKYGDCFRECHICPAGSVLQGMRLKLTVVVLLAVSGTRGQSFEVASVRVSGPATSKGADEVKRSGAVQVDGSQVDALRVTLADLVQQAYALKPFQL